MKKIILCTIFSTSLLFSYEPIISGSFENKKYILENDTFNEFETNIKIQKKINTKTNMGLSIRGINNYEYLNSNNSKGPSITELYIEHIEKFFDRDIDIKIGKQSIDTDFTNKENVYGKGITLKTSNSKKEGNINIGLYKVNNSLNEEDKDFTLGFLSGEIDLNEMLIKNSILFSNKLPTTYTTKIEKNIDDIKLVLRTSYQDNNNKNITIKGSKQLKDLHNINVTSAISYGSLDTNTDFFDNSTELGFGVFQKDVSNLKGDKYLVSIGKDFGDLEININDIYVRENSKHYIVIEGETKINDLLIAKSFYNLTNKSILLNFKYDF